MRIASLASPIAIAASLACVGCAGAKFWEREDDGFDTPPPATLAADDEAAEPDADSSTEEQRPPAPAYMGDGLRLPENMLTLPSDRELRRPVAPESGGSVTARPPVNPPEGDD